MKVNVVTVDSGWILQKISERIVNEGNNLGHDFIMTHTPSNDVDCNFYVDIQNCYTRKSNTLDIGLFTHMDRDSIDTVNKSCLSLDHIIHMCTRYYEKFKNIYDKDKMSVSFPAEVNHKFKQYKPTIGIFQRGRYIGKGFNFMRELCNHDIVKDFKFKFVGKDWDSVVDNLISKGVEVSYSNSEDYNQYPEEICSVDYVLIPSLWEGGPMSILEALASGKEIISSNVGFIGDFSVEYVYEPGDINGLTSILNKILEPIKKRRESTANITYKNYVNNLITIINNLKNEKT